jgi:hypothetical protein
MFFSTEALGSILGVYGPTSNLTERTCHRRPFPTHSSVSMHKLLHIHANIAKNLILGYLGVSTPVKAHYQMKKAMRSVILCTSLKFMSSAST